MARGAIIAGVAFGGHGRGLRTIRNAPELRAATDAMSPPPIPLSRLPRSLQPAAPGRRLLLTALLALPLVAACGRKPIRGRAVPPGAPVLAVGDSLTHGSGASAETSYPAVLAQLTGWNVVNAGVPGHTSAQALGRLPALLAEHAPALVLLGIGGNDFLRRVPEDETRANLRRCCETVLASGAQLLLIAVPRPSVAAAFIGSLTDHPLYGELAEELRLPLVRQGWAEVLADEALRADAIHANAAGYRRFAETVRTTALASGLLAA
jgi:acyl-CoA hydrolase